MSIWNSFVLGCWVEIVRPLIYSIEKYWISVAVFTVRNDDAGLG